MQHIFTLETQHECEFVRANLTFKVAKRAMITARQASIPVCPATIVELIQSLDHQRYPPLYQDMYLDSVHHDFRTAEGSVRKHAIILVNKPVLDDVKRTCLWYSMDATFKTTPRVSNDLNDRAAQVLIITADYHGSAVVVFVAVMQGRKTPLYKKVFQSIKAAHPTFEPAQMMSDYEKSMRRGFRGIYPDSKMYGCR